MTHSFWSRPSTLVPAALVIVLAALSALHADGAVDERDAAKDVAPVERLLYVASPGIRNYVEIWFRDRKPVRNGDQFGIGQVREGASRAPSSSEKRLREEDGGKGR